MDAMLDDDAAPLNAPAEVRAGDDEAGVDEWALVLTAAGIAHRVESPAPATPPFRLLVEEPDAARAAAALDDYDAERRAVAAERAAPAPPEYGRTAVGLIAAALILGFHAFVVRHPSLLDAGEAASTLILHGQPWRAVTALALHADWMHAFGNAVAMAIFLGAAGRWLGPGPGAWLTLAAGAIGNFATAAAHGPGHFSIGASTATFGALGVLAGLQFFAHRRRRFDRKRAWVAVAAAMGLFGMLGVGPNTDVLAHLFGLAAGLGLGVAAGRFAPPPRRGPKQWLAAVAALAAVAGCWLPALRH